MPDRPKVEQGAGAAQRLELSHRRQKQLLRLISDQGALPMDQLERFASVGEDQAEEIVSGFEALGWVRSELLLKEDRVWVWLTAKGGRQIGRTSPGTPPKPGGLRHRRGINEARLRITGSRPQGRWLCESQVRRRLSPGDHIPDAVFEIGRERHAIEIELTPKPKARLKEIVAEHCGRYDAVIYFCSEPVRLLLFRLAPELKFANLKVLPFPVGPGVPEEPDRGVARKVSSLSSVASRRLDESEQATLDLVGELEAVPMGVLCELSDLEPAAVKAAVRNLVGRRFMQCEKLGGGAEEWLWVRRAGLAKCRVDADARRPVPGRLDELRALSRARILLEERFPGSRWVSKFELRSRRVPGAKMPAALLETSSGSFAVEAEPRATTATRLTEIMESHCLRFDGAFFFCGEERRRALEEVARQFPAVEVVLLSSSPVGPRPPLVEDDEEVLAALKPMLSLLGEQGPIASDHLRRFLGCTEKGLMRLVDQANGRGLIERGDVIEQEAVWVWLSARGATVVGSDLRPLAPRLNGVGVARATNEARLYIQERAPQAVWISRRRLLREHGSHAQVPRGVVEIDGERHAIEVEVRRRSRFDLRAKYERRSEEFDAVVVFCGKGLRGALDEVCREERLGKVRTVPLPGAGGPRRRRGRPRVEESMKETADRGARRLVDEPSDSGLRQLFGAMVRERLADADRGEQLRLTMSELESRTGFRVHRVRRYELLGVIPGPDVINKVGYYGARHVALLGLATELLERGMRPLAVREVFDACRSPLDGGLSEMSLSQLSERTGVSERVLLMHCKKGILPPPRSDESGDWYDFEHAKRVMAVRELQAFGHDLASIKRYFDEEGAIGSSEAEAGRDGSPAEVV